MTPEEEKMVAGLQQNLWAAKRRTKDLLKEQEQRHRRNYMDYEARVAILWYENVKKNDVIKQLEELNDRNEGRRLFQLCVNKGAIPGHVYQWLKEKLQ